MNQRMFEEVTTVKLNKERENAELNKKLHKMGNLEQNQKKLVNYSSKQKLYEGSSKKPGE